MLPLILLIAVVATVSGFLLLRRRTGKVRGAASLRGRILKRVRDPKVLESLVRAEEKRHPSLGEAEVLRRVLKRLEHDARR